MSVIAYERRLPKWLRWIGCFDHERGCTRFRWGEISWHFGLCIEAASFEDHWSLILQVIYPRIYLKLPRWLPHKEPKTMMASWGVSWNWFDGDGNAIHLNWGDKSKIVWMPFGWKHVRHDVLCTNQRWRKHGDEDYLSKDGSESDRLIEFHPYRYLCLDGDGEIQRVTATVGIERREWRRLKWLPWPRKVSHAINVWFSEEVGDERGSWKGGCLGCGYEMLPYETALQALRRMERNRRFDK